MNNYTISKTPTPEQEAEAIDRWVKTMARIGVKPCDGNHHEIALKPTATGPAFDLLDIINGIADAADRAGAGKP